MVAIAKQVPPTAEAIPTPEIINRIVELIRSEMGLDAAHCVSYNQMIPIPTDSGIFVAVGILDSKPFGNSLSYEETESPNAEGSGETILEEVQSSNIRDVFSIHIMSRDNSARRRRQELPMALTGTAAAQAQDAHGFLIGKIPVGFVDASVTEGDNRLNRYVLTVAVLWATCLRKPVDYFNPPDSLLVTERANYPIVPPETAPFQLEE